MAGHTGVKTATEREVEKITEVGFSTGEGKLPVIIKNANSGDQSKLQLFSSDGKVDPTAHARFSELCFRPKNRLLYQQKGILMDIKLLRMVQKIGERYPNKTISIYSGVRNYGIKNGPHARGTAIDFSIRGVNNRELYIFLASTFKTGGFGYYPNNHPGGGSKFVHMDSRPKKTLWVDESAKGQTSRDNKNHELLVGIREGTIVNNDIDIKTEATHLKEEEEDHFQGTSELQNPDFDVNPQSIDTRPDEIIKEDYRNALDRANWIAGLREEGLTYYTDDIKLRNIFYRDIHCLVSSIPLAPQVIDVSNNIVAADNMITSAISVTFGNRIVSQKLLSQNTNTWQFLGAGNKTGTIVFTFAGSRGRESADNIKKMINHSRRNAQLFGSVIPDAGTMKLSWSPPDGRQPGNSILALLATKKGEYDSPNMDVIVTDFSEQSDPKGTDKHQLVVNFIVQDFAEERLQQNIFTSFDQKKRVISTIMETYVSSGYIRDIPQRLQEYHTGFDGYERQKKTEEIQNKWVISPNSEFIVFRDQIEIHKSLHRRQGKGETLQSETGKPWEIKNNKIPGWLGPIIIEAIEYTQEANELLPEGYGKDLFDTFAAGRHMKGSIKNRAKTSLLFKLSLEALDDLAGSAFEYEFNADSIESKRKAQKVFVNWTNKMDLIFRKVISHATSSDFDKYFHGIGKETIDSLVSQLGECYLDMRLPPIPEGNIPLPPDFYIYDDAHEDPAISTLTDEDNMEIKLQQHIRNERASVKHYMEDTILGGSYASRNLPRIMENRKHYLTQLGGESRDEGEFKFISFSQMLAEGTLGWDPVFYRSADSAYENEDAKRWVNRIISEGGGSEDESRHTFMKDLIKMNPYLNDETRHWVTPNQDLEEIVSDIYEDNWKKLAFGPNPDYKYSDTILNGNIPEARDKQARKDIKQTEEEAEEEQKDNINKQESGPNQVMMADNTVTFGLSKAEKDAIEEGSSSPIFDLKHAFIGGGVATLAAPIFGPISFAAGFVFSGFFGADTTLAIAEAFNPFIAAASYGVSALVQAMDHKDVGNLFTEDKEDKTRAKAAAGISIGSKVKDLSVRRAFPTFKIYFIEDDEQGSEVIQGKTVRAFDDFYSYSAVQEIRIVRSRKIAADLATLRITNVGGKLLRKRFGEDSQYAKDHKAKYGIEAEYETGIFADTEKENPFERMILQDGVKVQIRLGYTSNPDHLETVFLGSIVEISPCEDGKILELICQGFGAELEGIELGPLEDGPLFYSTQQALSGAIIQDSIINFGRRNKWNRFNSAEQRHAFTGGEGNGILSSASPSAVLQAWASSRQTRRLFKYPFKNAPQDDNIFAPPPSVYSSTWKQFWNNACTYRPLKQTPWQIFKEHELRHPGYISLAVPYGHSPRMTMFFGAKSQHYWKEPPSGLELFLSESAAEEIVKLRGLKSSKFKDEEFKKELEKLAKVNHELANAIVRGIDSFSHPVDVGFKLGEMFGRYKPFRNYHYFDSAHHILKNEIRTNRDGVPNEIEVLYFTDENSIESGLDDLSTSLQQLTRGEEGVMSCQLDENMPEEYIRSYREEFPSCITDDMARRYIQGLFARLLRDSYKGELIVLGEPTIKPYDICFLNDASINMTGPIEVEQVEHIFNRDSGFISIITPDLCLDINDYYAATTLDLMGASLAYAYGQVKNLSTSAIVAGATAAAVMAPVAVGATITSLLALAGGVKLIKHTQDGVPVIATPLTLGGKPFMSVSMGQKRGSLMMQWNGQWEQHWDDVKKAWNKFDIAEAIFSDGQDIEESLLGFLGAGVTESIPLAE